MSELRPWLAHYPPGVPANIDTTEYATIVDFLDEVLKKYAHLPAFTCMDGTLTYKDLDVKSRQFGAYLQSRGLKAGDCIALMMPNLLQYPIALFGALRAGLVVVNTNPLYTPREMKHQFVDSNVKAIIIADNFAANLEKILPDTNIGVIITTSIGELLGLVKGKIVDFVVKRVKRMVPSYNLPNTVKFGDAIKAGKKFSITPYQGGPDDVVVHQYTGGTTGVAKGAMLTNRNLVANMLQIRAWLKTAIPEGCTTISPLPMYHIFAFTVNCLSMLCAGAHTVLITNPRDLSTIVSAFNKHNITVMTGVNTLFKALLNHEPFRALDHGLNVTVGGGMAVQTAVATEWQEVTGCTLSEGYGMTEASPVVAVNPIDGTARTGSIGIPIPSTDVRIVDEDGQVCGFGEVGELQVKGPQVMVGYFNKPEETAATLVGEWLSTGDMARMDSDGYLAIVDRKKDMILVSGFNVYPNEIEDTICTHDKVLECAAIGVPDERSGEVVKVFVVKKDKSLSEKELIAFCREQMTGYKVPKSVEFRKDLPKSNVGKILRKELR